MNKRYKDLKGMKFGRLTAIDYLGSNKHGKSVWNCKCDCGNYKQVVSSNLINGFSQSCGCIKKEQLSDRFKKHGMTGTRIYRAWRNMKDRCYNKNNKDYCNYGERGITVCDDWNYDFQCFYNWAMNNGYSEDLTIERIDVNISYSPNNCKWILMKEQSANRRSNHYITINGKTKTISEWSSISGLNRETIRRRINRGITGEDLIRKGRVYTSK